MSKKIKSGLSPSGALALAKAQERKIAKMRDEINALKSEGREKCAEAGREVRRIQREYLREVAGEMKNALEMAVQDFDSAEGIGPWVNKARKALEKARRLGL